MQVSIEFTAEVHRYRQYCIQHIEASRFELALGASAIAQADSDTGIAELQKFLYLRATYPFEELSPSYFIDVLWRALLLFPPLYADVCSKMGDGKLISYDPFLLSGTVWQARYARTLELFKLHFFSAATREWPGMECLSLNCQYLQL